MTDRGRSLSLTTTAPVSGDRQPDLFGPLGLDLDGSCPSCGCPLDDRERGNYCEECT